MQTRETRLDESKHELLLLFSIKASYDINPSQMITPLSNCPNNKPPFTFGSKAKETIQNIHQKC